MNFTGKSIIENHTNVEMSNMLSSMEPLLDTAKGKFGYAIARNVRKLRDACMEYLQARQELLMQFGEETKDDSGNLTGNFSVKIGTPACMKYLEAISEFSSIQHSVEIYKIPYDILPEELTAKELINLAWMLYDTEPLANEENKNAEV